jgi:hypothetical protein
VSSTNIDTRKVIDVELLTYCQQWEYVKGNEDKFRHFDVWDENYCSVSGVMAAAGQLLYLHIL